MRGRLAQELDGQRAIPTDAKRQQGHAQIGSEIASQANRKDFTPTALQMTAAIKCKVRRFLHYLRLMATPTSLRRAVGEEHPGVAQEVSSF